SVAADRLWSSLMRSTEEGPPHREREERIAGGGEVVDHHAEPVLERLVELPDRRRLRDVEEAEEEERDADEEGIRVDKVQHEQESDDLVPDDRLVVGHAEVAAGHLRSPDADQRKDDDGDAERRIGEIRPEEHGNRDRDERSEGSGRKRR